MGIVFSIKSFAPLLNCMLPGNRLETHLPHLGEKLHIFNDSKVGKACLFLIGQWLKLAHLGFLKYNFVVIALLLLLAAEVATMHVKIIPNNQIASPGQSTSQVEAAGYNDVEVDSTAIVLTPVLAQSVEAVRDKLIASGISEKDVADACAWARRPKE